MTKKTLALAAAAASAIALAGCVSLFPKAEPAQLYRFGANSAPTAEAMGGNVALMLAPVDFNSASASDRILTSTGSEVAYIAAARWAAPARVMFSDSLEQAFNSQARVVSLGRRREQVPTLMLAVNVNSFEARYENGQGAAPTAVVSVTARLVHLPDRATVAHKAFEARQPASDNRVGAIVQALDAANGQVLGQLVQWTDQNAR